MTEGWQWDETLFSGSAPYYVRGRLPYAPTLAERLASELGLDGHGRLLDVGCGPGILTLPLARFFDEAIGVDPDAEMLEVAARRAIGAGIGNVRWAQLRGEDLPAGLGSFRAATFAQSFHWMDQPAVAATVYDMLDLGGAFVHVSDVKVSLNADRDDNGLPYPRPPRAAIGELLRHYLGPERRAGQGVLRHGTPGGEAEVLKSAGFEAPTQLRVSAGNAIVRSTDDIVAEVFSMSASAPHLFGDQVETFEAELRRLLEEAAQAGQFSEQPPDTNAFIWRKPNE